MPLMTYQQAADYLQVPIGTLYNWVSLQKIPHVRMSARSVRFRVSELEQWLHTREVDAQDVCSDAPVHPN